MKHLSYVLMGLSLICAPPMHAQRGWLERKAEGWAWYEDRNKKEEVEEKPPEVVVVPTPIAPPAVLSATEEMAGIRKELEERLAEAILRPTDANLVAYMQIQQHWIDRSAQFSQAWLRNLLNHPQLDARLTESPITQYGVQVHKQMMKEKQEQLIHELVKSHGLLFVYEGKHKASQAFSFVIKEFAKKYGWQVIGISCDSLLIPGFENNQFNQGIVQRLNIEHFPSLFLVEPKQQQVIPIAFGLASLDQIETNIETQLKGLNQ